jgi:hypothetical protein
MPLVTIDLLAGRTDQDLRQIGDSVHQAMVEQLNVPQRDRFQVVTQHSAVIGARAGELLVLPREQWR